MNESYIVTLKEGKYQFVYGNGLNTDIYTIKKGEEVEIRASLETIERIFGKSLLTTRRCPGFDYCTLYSLDFVDNELLSVDFLLNGVASSVYELDVEEIAEDARFKIECDYCNKTSLVFYKDRDKLDGFLPCNHCSAFFLPTSSKVTTSLTEEEHKLLDARENSKKQVGYHHYSKCVKCGEGFNHIDANVDTCPKCVENGNTEQQTPIQEVKQVGGNHYSNMKIQPVDFILENGLSFLEGNAIKYICRHKAKNGVEDIEKAIHYLEMILTKVYKKGK